MTTNVFRDALKSGSRRIGALVYWRGLSDVRIDRRDFRYAFESMGLGEAVGRDPKPEACLNQAASGARRGRDKDSAPVKVELVAKHTNAVYAVLMRRDDGARVRYLEEARVAVARDQPRPRPVVTMEPAALHDPEVGAVVDDIVAKYYDVLDNILTLECSEALVAAMGVLGGLPLRTGVYFVPEVKLGTVRGLQAWLEARGIRLTCWDIAASDENAAEARTDAREAFITKVKDLTAECRKFAESREEVNARSVNARVRHFHALDSQVALYADILGDFRDEMVAAVGDARREFLASLGLDDDAVAA